MLYREQAPISQATWDEMEEEVRDVFINYLSGRRVFHINGPKGFKYNAISEGRLEEAKDEDDVYYSTYKVQPLIESRVEFEMTRWELDNILRGAKDIDYDELEEAAKKIALFEEKVIFYGLEEARVRGLLNSSDQEAIKIGNEPSSIMNGITKAMIKLKENYANGPYSLIVGRDVYENIISKETAYPLDERIESLIGGKIIYNHLLEGAVLVPYNHEDLELTIGQDLSLGYQSHDNKKVRFFLMESFTFRVLDEDIIINLTI